MFHQKLSVQTLIYCLSLVRAIFATHYVDSLEKLRRLMVMITPQNTLREIIIMLQMHLQQDGLNWKLIDGVGFSQLHNVLDNTMKERTAMGLGSSKLTSVISLAQESLLFDKGLLGLTSVSQQLVQSVDTKLLLLVRSSVLYWTDHRSKNIRLPPALYCAVP